MRNWLTAFVEPRRVMGLGHLPRYLADWKRYNQLAGAETLQWQESYPRLTDWTSYTPFDAHYFYQAAWLARKLSQTGPARHIDVGSSIMMIGVTSAIAATTFVDYRPFQGRVSGLSSVVGDVLSLPFADASIYSLSCLHVIEHVGLGRYGGRLDPHGSVQAGHELSRVLTPQGHLFVSVPVGRERVQFNAHRVFAPDTILAIFADLALMDFAMVDDDGRFHEHIHPTNNQALRCEYACGIFEFIKR